MDKLGIDVGQGKHQPCPVCSTGDPKSNRFRFDDKEGKGTWFCNQCDPQSGDGMALVMRVLGIDFKKACETIAPIIGTVQPSTHQKETTITKAAMREIWMESFKLKDGDPVADYLNSRGLLSKPNDIRYHPGCWEPETRRKHKAMLAIFRLPDNTAVTMQRTYLSENGGKLDCKSPKKLLPLLPGKKMTGGAIRLYEPKDGMVGITEGIETAIAIHDNLHIPVWACTGAPHLQNFEPPKEIKAVLIFADNDKNFAGQKAAYTLAARLSKDYSVEVNVPVLPGDDFLDEIMREEN